MDDSPKGLLRELTTTVWNRRIILVALAVILAQSGLRLINALVAYVIVPLLATILTNTDSVLFRSAPRYAWEPLIYSALEFGLVVVLVLFGSRGMRLNRPATQTKTLDGRAIAIARHARRRFRAWLHNHRRPRESDRTRCHL